MEVMPGSDYPSNITGFPSAWLDRTYQVDAYGGFDASSNHLGIDKAWKAVSDLLAEANIDVKAELNADKTAVEAKAYVNFPLEINNARYGNRRDRVGSWQQVPRIHADNIHTMCQYTPQAVHGA